MYNFIDKFGLGFAVGLILGYVCGWIALLWVIGIDGPLFKCIMK